jgi:nitrite reductase (NADH) small subunit
MIQVLPVREQVETGIDVCELNDITPHTGVCALVETSRGSAQVAVFRFGDGIDVFALCNFDPFSKAYVLSRGLVGDRQGIPKVASPIYKHNFDLLTGQCLDDENVKVRTFPARVVDGKVQVAVGANS